jgi:hypothetical protein
MYSDLVVSSYLSTLVPIDFVHAECLVAEQSTFPRVSYGVSKRSFIGDPRYLFAVICANTERGKGTDHIRKGFKFNQIGAHNHSLCSRILCQNPLQRCIYIGKFEEATSCYHKSTISPQSTLTVLIPW